MKRKMLFLEPVGWIPHPLIIIVKTQNGDNDNDGDGIPDDLDNDDDNDGIPDTMDDSPNDHDKLEKHAIMAY